MKALFLQTREFARKWAWIGLADEDLQVLELQLMAAPTAGPVMEGTGGLRKMRFAAPSMHSGKRGATRVCYVWLPGKAMFVLWTIYTKSEKDNLTRAERNLVRKTVEKLKEVLR